MNKKIKNIVNKTIENEFHHVTGKIDELNKFEDYKELDYKNGEIQNKVFEVIPEQYHDLINELIESFTLLSGTESKFAFKKGVIAALTNLKYLEEIGEEIILI
ncbi:hypothetical protein [Clostridium novyi]|uniref:Uncharacterized protein n=1 Tax=Clostridium novyi (strain NT) TaxID=386415 RepID=A0Q3S7_CLONN|nr:hypothetical protein [Clostridium novyi]ABK62667.1 hypothetical protein NT01CX_0839 [Clostridium novyi NT]KEH85290.1 hypothetical protein Z966_07655 [Clostridium novyi A str. NCTC 538]